MGDNTLADADQALFDRQEHVIRHLASAGRPANVLEADQVGAALRLHPADVEPLLQGIVDQQVSVRMFLRRRWPNAFSTAELAAGLNIPRGRVEDLLALMPAGVSHDMVYRGRRTGGLSETG